MNETIRSRKRNDQAFTLLEVMIAVSIFGLLLLYASQFMRTEIRTYDYASEQNEIQQKARVALMQIVDEVRLDLTYYKATSDAQSIYRYKDKAAAAAKDQIDSTCLIYISLQAASVTPPSTAKIFFDKPDGELWYIKDGNRHLIADQISHLSIEGDSSQVKIDIRIGGHDGSEPYELLTWVRLD